MVVRINPCERIIIMQKYGKYSLAILASSCLVATVAFSQTAAVQPAVAPARPAAAAVPPNAAVPPAAAKPRPKPTDVIGSDRIEGNIAKQRLFIQRAAEHGIVSPEEKAQDETRLQRIETELAQDKALHGGQVIRAEVGKLNRELHNNEGHINWQFQNAMTKQPTAAAVAK